MDLDALLAEADRLVAEAEPELVPVVIAGRQLGVRYVPMSGQAWRDLVLLHPPRPDVVQDMNLGYDVDAVVSAYPHVAVVEGDEVDDLVRVDAEGSEYSAWPAVWKRLSATGKKEVAASVWAAHERTPERLIADAGKAPAPARKKKRT